MEDNSDPFYYIGLAVLFVPAYMFCMWIVMISWGAILPHTPLAGYLPALGFKDVSGLWLFF